MRDFGNNLQEFIKATKPQLTTDTILHIAYFFENCHAKQHFSVAEMTNGFLEARIPLPANLHDVVSKAARHDLLICDRKSKPLSYQLSQYGIERVEQRLQDLNVLNRGDEETKLISQISQALYSSVTRVTDIDERGYVQEALRCLDPRLKAYRAAVLMAWIGTIFHLRKRVEEKGFDKFCQAYEGLSLGKPKHISSIDDLEFCKDKDFLLVVERMGIMDKATRQQLESCLNLRNGCAHPTQLAPKIQRVKAFFEDVIEYVFSR